MERTVVIEARGYAQQRGSASSDHLVRFLVDGIDRYALTFSGRGAEERARKAATEWEIGEAVWMREVIARG
jgi:hypothetical protein